MELFEDRYGYGIEEDEFESELVPVRRVPVYTIPATNTNPERTLAVVTNLGRGAPSFAIREPLRQQQGNQQQVIQEQRQAGAEGELASISTESEATAAYRNTYGFLEHRAAGQGTSANPNPPQPGLSLDRPRVQAVAANQAPMVDQVAPVAAEVYERQIAKHTTAVGSASSITEAIG